jgi:membrane associated rhomboid family serine protease
MKPALQGRTLATAALAGAMVAVFAAELAGDGHAICQRFGFVAARPSFGTALSSLFLHDPENVWHVGGNLALLVLFGVPVERSIGPGRFVALFVAGGLAGTALHVVVEPSSLLSLVGCSGALFAVLAVAAGLYGPPVLVFVGVLVVANVAQAFGAGADGTSFGAHLGGFVMGVALVAVAQLRGDDVGAVYPPFTAVSRKRAARMLWSVLDGAVRSSTLCVLVDRGVDSVHGAARYSAAPTRACASSRYLGGRTVRRACGTRPDEVVPDCAVAGSSHDRAGTSHQRQKARDDATRHDRLWRGDLRRCFASLLLRRAA